jgi:trehalose-phosphatase
VRILRPGLNLDHFFARLARAERRVLMLDYDGTLAPFRVDRARAIPYPGVREAVAAILASERAHLVVVSGRAIDDLLPLLRLERLPEVWGAHGWERLTAAGRYSIGAFDSRGAQGRAEAREWIAQQGFTQYAEEKPASIALHWRGLAPGRAESLRAAVLGHWGARAPVVGLELHLFDGGAELRIPGRDKGFAVRTVLAEAGAGAVAAYVGDDLTDEDAFGALSGQGLGVLVRAELRPTAADIWLQPPHELLAFLARWLEACKG